MEMPELSRPITDMTSRRLLICIALWYRRERLKFFFEQARCLAEMPVASLDLVITTQTTNRDELAEIKRILSPLVSTGFTPYIVSCPKKPWYETYYLTWEHKRFIAEWFLDPSREYTHFIYMEDDIRFTAMNLAYFITFTPILSSHRLLPAFIRVEYNDECHRLFYTDLTEANDLSLRASVEVGGVHFVNPINPYCAVLVLDREMAERHVESPAFDLEGSKAYGMYNTSERANMGFTFDNYPYEAGFTNRYVIPVSVEDHLPILDCVIEHLPGTFTKKPRTDWGFGHTPIENGFVGVPGRATITIAADSLRSAPLHAATPHSDGNMQQIRRAP